MSDEAQDEWDFYYCRVDDAPASIFLNFAYRHARPANLDTLYFAGLQMLEPGEHGMGDGGDAEKLWQLEDRIIDAAAAHGLCYVGRLRNQGDWQLTFYGNAGKEEAFEALVVDALSDVPDDRGYRVGSKPDAEWGYYEDFLLPDRERWQWIMDRRVVQQLAKAGDAHDIPRPVDHFIHFEHALQRDAFIEAARKKGFQAEEGPTEEGADRPYGAALVRNDATALNHIHDVVMDLIELAESHDGEYDGWGAPIVKP